MREPLARSASGIMPRRAELAAAAEAREDSGAAALEPEFANGRVVVGKQRNAEPAIAMQVDWRVAGFTRRTDLNIGHPGAVGGHGLVTRHHQAIGVEDPWRALHQLRR